MDVFGVDDGEVYGGGSFVESVTMTKTDLTYGSRLHRSFQKKTLICIDRSLLCLRCLLILYELDE